jgi:site-specific DNA recombinase
MTPRQAVMYTRVSSREQEQEGFSLDAQAKLLRVYAERNAFEIVRAFEDVESAKATGRKQFGEMVTYLRRASACRVLLVEKTDRLYRNYKDALTIQELDIETHLVKENIVLSKNSKSSEKFMQDIHLAVARHYIENLKEEVGKAMEIKAAKGIYPARAPFGYINNKAARTIEIHPERGAIAQRVFEMYGSGRYSLKSLAKTIRDETGMYFSKANVHQMLNNVFYIGQFVWRGRSYSGTHTALITSELFAQVQAVMHGFNKPKYSKRDVAFRGLLKCAHDDCVVTAEVKKEKYVYYRCSGGRGPCDLPRFREQEIAEKLGHVLERVYIPPEIAKQIESELMHERAHSREHFARERARLVRMRDDVRRRMDAAYMDKLDGKIAEDFWQRKQAEWQAEEVRIASQIERLKEPDSEQRMIDVHRILELAQNAHSLCLTRKPAEQAEILKSVLLNCSLDAVSLYPTYRSPFDLIVKRAENDEWSGRADLNCRPLAPQASALPG